MAYRLTCRPTTSCRLTHATARKITSSQEKLSSADVIAQKITYLKERQQAIVDAWPRTMTSSTLCLGAAMTTMTYAPPNPLVAIFSIAVAAHGLIGLTTNRTESNRLEEEIKKAFDELEVVQRQSYEPQVPS